MPHSQLGNGRQVLAVARGEIWANVWASECDVWVGCAECKYEYKYEYPEQHFRESKC